MNHTIKARDILSESWEIFKKNPLKVIFVFVIAFLLSMAIEMLVPTPERVFEVPEDVATAYQEERVGIEELEIAATINQFANLSESGNLPTQEVVVPASGSSWAYIPYIIGIVALAVVSMTAYLQFARSQQVTFKSVFVNLTVKKFGFLAAVLVLYILIVAVGFILLIIPGIIFSLMFYYAPLLVIDKGMAPVDALKESMRITRGYKWCMVRMGILTIGVVILGILALLVGLIIALPLVQLLYPVLYTHLVDQDAHQMHDQEDDEEIIEVEMIEEGDTEKQAS